MLAHGQRDVIHFLGCLLYPEGMIQFSKYHGLGNDFILIDLQRAEHADLANWSAWAKTACKRGHGIGADGVLLASRDPQSDLLKMEVINGDGSQPEMCGNGLRCFVHFAVEELGVMKTNFNVETGAGNLLCSWRRGEAGEFLVKVEMGTPSVGKGPVEFGIDEETTLSVHPASMGNPHGIIFLEREMSREWMKSVAHKVEQLSDFPDGVNVGFARVLANEVQLTVHERGCGFTEACGTGACAAVAVAMNQGYVSYGRAISVELPGGTLFIQWHGEDEPVWMEGPSVRVMAGNTFL